MFTESEGHEGGFELRREKGKGKREMGDGRWGNEIEINFKIIYAMQSYRDLIVWKKSMLLVTSIYKLTDKFPDDEKFGLTSQIKRSAVSIPSNIAEGYGRNYRKDYSRFLQVSRGSLYENQTQMEIAINLLFLNEEDLKEIKELSLEVEKMLNSLIKKLE